MDEAAEKSRMLDAIGSILGIVRAIRDTGGKPVVPVWLIPIAAVVVATLYYFLRRIDLLGLLSAWAKAATPGPDPVEHPPSPPMDLPPGGMPIPGPGDRWDRNEP